MTFIVIYKNKRYNIINYLEEHPGGKKILQRYKDKDITKVFGDIGHSDEALEIMKSYVVQTIENEENEADKNEKTNENDYSKDNRIIKKLFTQEDSMNIHKTLALLSIISYIYRYNYIIRYGSFGFDNKIITLLTFLIHMSLSLSSLIFDVIERKIATNPLTIHTEYRLHAILFSVRSIVISMIGLYEIKYKYACALTSLVCHILVDIVTYLYGLPGNTAVRSFPDADKIGKSLQLLYSFYQFIALGSHISNKLSIEEGFNGMIAIQSSAFLMTLRKKNLIANSDYVIWYGLSLVLSTYVFMLHHNIVFFILIGILFYIRVNYRTSKYIIWFIFTIIYHNHGELRIV